MRKLTASELEKIFNDAAIEWAVCDQSRLNKLSAWRPKVINDENYVQKLTKFFLGPGGFDKGSLKEFIFIKLEATTSYKHYEFRELLTANGYNLINAVKDNNNRLASFLLRVGADADQMNESEQTPLSLASMHKDLFLQIVRDPNYTPTTNVRLAVLCVTIQGDAKMLEVLFDKIDQTNLLKNNPSLLNKPCKSLTEDYALHVAVKKNDAKKVRLLMEHGADADQVSESGCAPLSLASKYKNLFLQMVRDSNYTPTINARIAALHLTFTGNVDMLNALLFKIDQTTLLEDHPDLLNEHSFSCRQNYALHIVAENGETEMARLLMTYGANPNQINNEGKSPLDLAKTNEMKQILQSKKEVLVSTTVDDKTKLFPNINALSSSGLRKRNPRAWSDHSTEEVFSL